MNNIKFTASMVIVVIALIIAPTLFAQGDSSPTFFATAPANVRSGPGLDYTVRGVAYPGEEGLTVTGRNNVDPATGCNIGVSEASWLRVDYHGIEGWVSRCSGSAVNVQNVPVTSPAFPMLRSEQDRIFARMPEVDESRPDVDFIWGFTRERLNIRTAPGLGAEVQDVARAIEDVYVTGRTQDGHWVEVYFNGKTGWAFSHLMLLPRTWENAVPVK